MEEFSDKVIYKTNQHIIVFIIKFIKFFFFFSIPISILVYLFSDYSIIWFYITLIITGLISWLLSYFFWSKWYFIITNEKIALKVRNWLFSKYHISIYFKNIKDIAYSKNHVLHYLLNYWTFFARSWWWVQWDFLATNLPDVETIYKYVSFVLWLSEKERKEMSFLDIQNSNKSNSQNEKNISKEEIIESEKNNLVNIKWVKEIILLDQQDKDYIFANEEDNNHWVYECIKKEIVFCITHDSNFRDPDEVIVLKLWNKVIFPAVSFHEVKQKNVVSWSPGVKIHQYLSPKFHDIDEYDATILIGFNT